ncbi:Hypothetical protein PHPALM_9578 [Phytophthora palmivora]|uniref:Uncharacterized protein n=1 Tax=Phytophthora palmivora TaxID=4796 RepID=A0A2P4Y6X7_9STRA|nr:Hypothetical protein PHPALM_9578 [Phytophthora palmivora]
MVWGALSTEDNASIHAPRETTHFLKEMEGVTMQNVWSVMAAKVYAHGRQYSTTAQLEDTIQDPWDSIEQAYLLKLVESMPRRCLAVIKKQGDLTTY